MNRFLEQLNKMFGDFAGAVRFLLFGLAAILLWKGYTILFPSPVISQEVFTNLMSMQESDALLTSGGRSGNYTFITLADKYNGKKHPEEYWPRYSAFEAKISGKTGTEYDAMRQKGVLCGYETDFTFGYTDRAEAIKWLLSANTTEIKFPSVIATNKLWETSMQLKADKGKKDDTNKYAVCNSYYNGSGSEAGSNTPALNEQCKLSPKDCGKWRVSKWLEQDEVLKPHLMQGIRVLADTALGEYKQCKRMADASVLPEYCSAYNVADAETIMARRDKKIAAILSNTDAFTGYNPVDGSVPVVIAVAGSDGALSNRQHESITGLEHWLIGNAVAAGNPTHVGGERASNAAALLTFSTLATFSISQKQYWGLGIDNEFAFRRDVAEVYFGTTLPAVPVSEPAGNYLDREISTVQLPEPERQAIHRWTTDFGVLYKGNLNKLTDIKNTDNKPLGTWLNDAIQASLDKAIKEHEGEAIRLSKQILNSRYSSIDTVLDFGNQKSRENPLLKLFGGK